MKVLFTATALSDLIEIGDHIRQDNPGRAETFTTEIVRACEALTALPFGFPVVPRYKRQGYRRRVHRDYLIIYSVRSDDIAILRITHGARDLARLLDRETP